MISNALKLLLVLYEKFMENVIDPIASVRQGGAVAVAKLLSVNNEVFPKVVAFLEESFKGLKDQSENNSKFGIWEFLSNGSFLVGSVLD